MQPLYILRLSDSRADLATAGGKGASLARLSAEGLPVPEGFHVTTAAYDHFVAENELLPIIAAACATADVDQPVTLQIASQTIQDSFVNGQMPEEIAQAIVLAYDNLPGTDPAVAVRSSATAEDLPDLSFAGQQESFLNICGPAAVQEAVKRCWASLWTARAIGYRSHHQIGQDEVSLAVVVQLLVLAEASGILFTANPLTGRRDQIIISAAWGLGEAIVGGLVTPDSLIVDKTTGQVVERETADKQLMTVRQENGTDEHDTPDQLRHRPALSDEEAAGLARLGVRIEALYGLPMDIEWTLAEGKLAVVQARPITALPEPEPAAPTNWKLPAGAYVAMRNNIVELMVDPLSPLFKTFGLSAVNRSMGDLLAAFFGKRGIAPEELIIAVNDYAYYNGSLKPWRMMMMILDSVGIFKRMFTGAVERWTEAGRPRYAAIVENWRTEDWRRLPATELLSAASQLLEAAIDAYGALVSGVIPGAWMSEALFNLAYKLVKRRGDPAAPTFLMGYNSLPIRSEKSLYDLAQWARSDDALVAYLDETPSSQLAGQLGKVEPPQDIDGRTWAEWRELFQAHLKAYGHTIYNLDFANPVPADDPSPLLDTMKLFLKGQGTNPHTRQQAAAQRREQATQAMLKRLKGLRLRIFRNNLNRAQRYAPMREDGLADVGLSYPLLRQMLLELGRRFVEGGLIEEPDDIFWLEEDEVENATARLDGSEALNNLAGLIPGRKAARRAARRVSPPMMLPQIKIPGPGFKGLKSKRAERSSESLKGVAASPGRVTAPACVVHGPADFGQMKAGDVLVASITTPAWMPLFARASAIVTDIGGPLSHGSIVAREYGIPAVLGTGSATSRIRKGQIITVDGSEGTVYLKKEEISRV